MKQLLEISQQTLWQILGKIVTSLSTFVILGLVARNYGEEGTGVFTLALTYLAIFYLLSDFGFNAHVLRKLNSPSGARSEKLKVEWRKLLGTRLIWSVVLVILALGLLPFWPFTTPQFSQAVLFGSLAVVASAIFVTCNLIFQSQLRYDLSVLASTVGTIAGLGAFVYLVLAKYPLPSLLLAHLVGWVAIATAALLVMKKVLRAVSPILDKTYVINLFKKSWPIAATLSLNVLYFRADAFMITYFKGASDTGVYNVAYSLFQTVIVLPTFIMNAYYPMMLKKLTYLKWVALGLLTLAFLGTIITVVLSPMVVTILTGRGFEGASLSLQILSVGFPAYFLSGLLMWIMVAKGRYKQLLLIYAVGLLVNFALNLVYIPQYSFYAASWITVISEYLILGMQIMVLLFK